MSKVTFNLGFALGAVVREFLRAVKKTDPIVAFQPQANSHGQLPPPCIPDSQVHEMDHFPAIVRTKGVDLNLWYAVNTRTVEKTSRKPRSKAKVQQLKPAAC